MYSFLSSVSGKGSLCLVKAELLTLEHYHLGNPPTLSLRCSFPICQSRCGSDHLSAKEKEMVHHVQSRPE